MFSRFYILGFWVFFVPALQAALVTSPCPWNLKQYSHMAGRVPYFLEHLPRLMSFEQQERFFRVLGRSSVYELKHLEARVAQSFARYDYPDAMAALYERAFRFHTTVASCQELQRLGVARCHPDLIRGIFSLYAEAYEAFQKITLLHTFPEQDEIKLDFQLRSDLLILAQLWIKANGGTGVIGEGKVFLVDLPKNASEKLASVLSQLRDRDFNFVLDPELTALGYFSDYKKTLYPGIRAWLDWDMTSTTVHELDHFKFSIEDILKATVYEGQLMVRGEKSFPRKLGIPFIPNDQAKKTERVSFEEMHTYAVTLLYLAEQLKSAQSFLQKQAIFMELFQGALVGEVYAFRIHQSLIEVDLFLPILKENFEKAGLTWRRIENEANDGSLMTVAFTPINLDTSKMLIVSKYRDDRILATVRSPDHIYSVRLLDPRPWMALIKNPKRTELLDPVFQTHQTHLSQTISVAKKIEPVFERIRTIAMHFLDTHEEMYVEEILAAIESLRPFVIHPIGP